jgi:cell division transport system ATP-binding protein
MEKELLIKYIGVDICQQELIVLKNIDIEVYKGEFIYLLGKVGSGKSSLLKSFYYELPIYAGEARIFSYNLRKLKQRDIPHLRRKFGIIYQDFQLLTDRTVEENLSFVLKATGWKNKEEIKGRINEVLTQVGMVNKGYKMPHQLSGGEQQRIVIARALLNSPDIILADEPTGHLDWETGAEIVQLLYDISKEQGCTVIMSTHNLNWVEKFSGRILRFEGEKVCEN